MKYADHSIIQEFVKNKKVNAMYAHITIAHLGVSLIGIFIPIYLYILGYTIPMILFFEFLYAFFYIAITPLVVFFIEKSCINTSFIASAPFRILFFLLLVYLGQYPFLFYLLPLLLAIRFSMYNISFHFNMLVHSKAEKNGKDFALIHILFSVGSFAAPYLGALLITRFGFDANIYATITILIISVIPLMGIEETCLVEDFNHRRIWKNVFNKQKAPIIASHAGYAVESLIGKVLWPLFLFLYLGSIEVVGFVSSLALLISAIAFYVIGKLSDTKDRKHLIKRGSQVYSLSWIARIAALNPVLIVFSDIFRNIAEKLMLIPWSAYSYEIAKKDKPFEFIVTREITINLVRLAIVPFCAMIFAVMPVTYAFATLFILAAVTTLFVADIIKA